MCSHKRYLFTIIDRPFCPTADILEKNTIYLNAAVVSVTAWTSLFVLAHDVRQTIIYINTTLNLS